MAKLQETESLSVAHSMERLTKCLETHFYHAPNIRIWTVVPADVVFTYSS